ncbi:MAG: hypothetical protein JWP47_1121 [Polaromonas sp.]|jgi:hypothetical protein|nr:hypothetical protein [Polaromonas sp.]
MNPMSNGSLTITDDNRHQYLETAIAEVSKADHLIRRAETCGQLRRQRESELKQLLTHLSLGALTLVALGAVLALLMR